MIGILTSQFEAKVNRSLISSKLTSAFIVIAWSLGHPGPGARNEPCMNSVPTLPSWQPTSWEIACALAADQPSEL